MLLNEFIERLIACAEAHIGGGAVRQRRFLGANHGYIEVTINNVRAFNYHPGICSNTPVDSRLRTKYLTPFHAVAGRDIGGKIDACVGN